MELALKERGMVVGHWALGPLHAPPQRSRSSESPNVRAAFTLYFALFAREIENIISNANAPIIDGILGPALLRVRVSEHGQAGIYAKTSRRLGASMRNVELLLAEVCTCVHGMVSSRAAPGVRAPCPPSRADARACMRRLDLMGLCLQQSASCRLSLCRSRSEWTCRVGCVAARG